MNAPLFPIAVPFAAIVLAMLPAVLDQTILATALPTIATDLGRLTDVSWVVTAYVVAAAAATPLWGKLGDRHGRKRLLELALALFLAASALCGVGAGHHAARRRPRRPGRRRRRADDARDGRRRRPRRRRASAAATRATSRPSFAVRHRRRAADRRPAGRARELALGLLRQPAARRSPRSPGCACGCPAAARRRVRPPARRPRRRAAGRRDQRVHARLHLGRRALRLGLGDDPRRWSPRSCCSAARSCCASGARPTRSSRSRCCARARSRSPAPRCSSRTAALFADHRVRAAVPADDHRRERRRGRAAAGADDARHHAVDEPRRAGGSRAPGATSASRSPASR